MTVLPWKLVKNLDREQSSSEQLLTSVSLGSDWQYLDISRSAGNVTCNFGGNTWKIPDKMAVDVVIAQGVCRIAFETASACVTGSSAGATLEFS